MFSKPHSHLALSCAFVLGLAACGPTVNKHELIHDPHFWQRSEATAAIYQRGPKAQQMLNRDISRCVTELRELERLGLIRSATPAPLVDGVVPDPSTPEGNMAQWDTPERDGYLRAEHMEYHDFETCMIAKGWERVEHVPYDVGEESRDDYIEAITNEQYRTNHGLREYETEPENYNY